jgi:DNA (cytosine-5)-methyltransferase 1
MANAETTINDTLFSTALPGDEPEGAEAALQHSGTPGSAASLTVAGLFAGIGGIELGLQQAHHRCVMLCEILPEAQSVLRARFPDVPVTADIRALPSLPEVDLVTAGFPCQDLSPVGRTAGIDGTNSSLVQHVIRLLAQSRRSPRWLLFENVPFMLQLDRGRAMHCLTQWLTELGYQWAYRVVDTRAFGIPHRRRRVLLLASRSEDPRRVLFGQEEPPEEREWTSCVACGFYWTEGNRGLGWAVDAIPTLKGGSGIGIPSPPGIWVPGREFIGTPDIRDGERLQGFPPGWTEPVADERRSRRGIRWKMVGNAVSVPVARWLGVRLRLPTDYDTSLDERLQLGARWPCAAWGWREKVYRVHISEWPVRTTYQVLLDFLKFPMPPLSARSTAGFLARACESRLRLTPAFLEDVATHLRRMQSGSQQEFSPSALHAG